MRFFYWIILSILPFALSAQNGQLTLSGRLADPQNHPIGYANVILKSAQDTLTVYGTASDHDGLFSLKVPRGAYQIQVSFLGYEPHRAEVSLTQATNLETIALTPSATDIDAVVVVAEAVTRESDRFIVNVAGSPYAIGQTAKEMLELSPGVWVNESGGISINGKSDAQVIINDRILRESGEELVNYLKTIKAEDILRIEVIPMGGVEYEAATQGGIIKITLKRQRENGLEGSVNMRYNTRLSGYPRQSFQPGFNINYRINKASIYLNVTESSESTTYNITGYRENQNGVMIDFTGDMKGKIHGGTLRGGVLYDINEKHSVGAEVNFQGYLPQDRSQLLEESVSYPDGRFENLIEDYKLRQRDKTWNLSGNYIAQLDDAGSSFKLLLDYANTLPWRKGYYVDKYLDREWNPIREETYRSLNESSNNLYSAAGAFDLRAGEHGRVKTGFKYMFSEVDSRMVYEYLTDGEWIKHPEQSYDTRYEEHISAVYGNYSYAFPNNIGLSAGMRVEHTYAQPAAEGLNNIERQNYFNFFPNANLSIPLNKSGRSRLIFSYSRQIRRPNFWLLVPLRIPASATETRVGNPKLKPRFSDELAVNWVFAKKYTVTAGALLLKDDWSWLARVDPENPEKVITSPENRARNNMWYMTVAIPAQVTRWWNLTANVTGSLAWYDIEEFRKTNHRVTGNINNAFTLREGTNLILSASGQTAMHRDYTERGGFYTVNAGITQQFLKNKLTAGAYVYDIFDSSNVWAYNRHPEYLDAYYYNSARPMLTLSVRYNFKTGKEFKAKTVESGADTSRISGAQ